MLFKEPLLKTIEHPIRGTVLVLSELSGFSRSYYLQEISPDEPVESGESIEPGVSVVPTYKDIWGGVADQVKGKLRLVAYSICAAESLPLSAVDELHAELCAEVPDGEVYELHKAAAELSGLWVDVVEEEGAEETSKKPDSPASPLVDN